MKAHIVSGSSRQELGQMRRWFKLLCVALYQRYDFGPQRLGKVIDEISRLSDEQKDDPVFWEHVDRLLVDQLGMNFDKENYKEVDR
jgi:hypothetical protein